MVQTPIRFKKGIAIELRRKGLSYSDIQNSINVPRSTIAYWLKDIELSDEQAEKLRAKRSAVAKSNSQKRTARILRETEDLKRSSVKEVGGITKRELWLMGIIMYWKNKNDLGKGVYFSSSDSAQIKLFLKWLKEIGGIKNEEIAFDIFAGKDQKHSINKVVEYWSTVTSFPANLFSRVYYLNKKSQSSFLRIRVKASSMLARQMAGWIEGVRRSL